MTRPAPLRWAATRMAAATGGQSVSHVVYFVGLTALTHVLFFGDDRYHLVVSPLLCLLAAAALRQVTPVTATRPRRDLSHSDSALVPSSVPRSS